MMAVLCVILRRIPQLHPPQSESKGYRTVVVKAPRHFILAQKSYICHLRHTQVVSDAVNRAALPGARPSAGQAVVAAVTGALAARYQDSWPHALAGAPSPLALLFIVRAPGLFMLTESASHTSACIACMQSAVPELLFTDCLHASAQSQILNLKP